MSDRWPTTMSLEVAAEFASLAGLHVWNGMEAVRGPGRRRRAAARREKRRCAQCGVTFTPARRRGPVPSHCSGKCYKRGHGAKAYRAVKRDPEQYQVRLLAARAQQERRRRERGAVPWPQRKLSVAATYGAWVVLRELVDRRERDRMVLCRCVCGTEKAVRLSHLRSGRSAHCSRCSARERRARQMAGPQRGPVLGEAKHG